MSKGILPISELLTRTWKKDYLYKIVNKNRINKTYACLSWKTSDSETAELFYL